VNFDTKYLPGDNEVHEYTVCGLCGGLVTSSTLPTTPGNMEHEYPTAGVSSSYVQDDQDAFGDRSGKVADASDVFCEVDLTNDDDGNTMCACEPSPFSPNHRQTLKNSYSASFEQQQNVEVASFRSATLDNGDFGELSRDSLKLTRELYIRSLSCVNCCTGTGSEILPVEGLKDILYCTGCSAVHGVDDSMNYYDLLQRGDYAVEACVNCGNSDPYLFLLEGGSDPDSVNLRCMKCNGTGGDSGSIGDVEPAAAADEDGLEQDLKEWIHYECKCNNANSDLQQFMLEPDSNTIFVKCWVCQREDVIPLDSFKPKAFCTCNNSESVDVKYDEYGYASRLACEQCRAELDCGGRSAADVAAAGDGASTGRTRISSLADIQLADHIALHQMLGYWHHAIVTDTGTDGLQIRVVHYNGPSLPNKGTPTHHLSYVN